MKALPERIRRKIVVNLETGCWEWHARRDARQYGSVMVGSRTDGTRRTAAKAHRVVYEALRGAIPTGLVLDHLCRVHYCVNPAHLEPVTDAENIRRGEGNRPQHKTHCPRGHPYDDENTYVRNGNKHCKICRRASHRRMYQRKSGLCGLR